MRKKAWGRILTFLSASILSVAMAASVPLSVSAASVAAVSATGTAAAAGVYESELTGEPISTAIAGQRPIAVMVDNEITALPHYNTSNADIVYEMVNSLQNGRITRLMCIYKDWQNLSMTGNIRSTRPTNILTAQEYNAVIVHDGGPFYNNPYFARYNQHLSGGFARVNNGKAREFTEYIDGQQVASRMAAAGISVGYTQGADVTHFAFVPAGTAANLALYGPVVSASSIVDLSGAFPHTTSKLIYDPNTQKYTYSEYGTIPVDAATSKTMQFDNVILQNVTYHQYDRNGYLIYNCIGMGIGWYITKGQAVPVIWQKTSESGDTVYIGGSGAQIQINRGKTYVGLIPNDSWNNIGIQ